MLQIMLIVGSFVNGSSTAVSGCGTRIMSLSLMACQPRMLEPSKPRPSSKMSSVSLFAGMVKCCQMPGKSMNRRSTALTSFSRHSAKTSLGFTVPSPIDQSNVQKVCNFPLAPEYNHRLRALALAIKSAQAKPACDSKSSAARLGRRGHHSAEFRNFNGLAAIFEKNGPSGGCKFFVH